MRRRSLLGIGLIVVVALGLGVAVNAALENVFSLQGGPDSPGTIDILLKGIAVMVGAAAFGALGLLLAGWLLTGEFLWVRSPLVHLLAAAEGLIRSMEPRQRTRWMVSGGALFLIIDLAVLFLVFQVSRVNLRVWSSSPGLGITLLTAAGEALAIVLLGSLTATQVVYFRWLGSISSSDN